VMVSSLRAVAGGTAAARDIQIPPRCMRPGILHGRRQRDRLALDQLGGREIDVVMREVGSDVRIERKLL
jgi:hypothetical protein